MCDQIVNIAATGNRAEHSNASICRNRVSRTVACQIATAVCVVIAIIVVIALMVASTNHHLPKEVNPILDKQYDNDDFISVKDQDACEDFNKFACEYLQGVSDDSWELETSREINELYKEPVKYDEHIVVKITKNIYKACVEETEHNRYHILQPLLKVSKWPMLYPSDWNEEEFNWLEESYKLRAFGLSHAIFLEVSIVVHPSNKSKHIIKVALPQIALPEKIIMEQIANILVGEVGKNNLQSEIAEAYNFIKILSEYETTENLEYSMFTIHEYQAKMEIHPLYRSSTLNWLRFINTIIHPAVELTKHDYVLFPPLEKIIVRLNKLMNTSKRGQANYFMWKAIEHMTPYLFNTNAKERCKRIIRERFVPNPFDILYVKRYLPLRKIKALNELGKNIKESLSELMGKSDWLDIHDKSNLVRTIDDMTLIMGAPPNYFQNNIFNELNVELTELDAADNFVEMLLKLGRNYQTYWYKQLNRPVLQWGIHLTNLSYGNYDDNLLEITATSIRYFMYNELDSDSLNYGGLGTFIAYFQIFSLLGKGKESINDESEITILSNKSKKALNNKLACLLSSNTTGRPFEKYGLFRNIISVKAAYLAYQKTVKDNKTYTESSAQYTSNQIFWIASMRLHCYRPDRFKIWAIELNNLDLGKDFNCPAGSMLNNSTKCDLY